jgi:hypothetical protein
VFTVKSGLRVKKELSIKYIIQNLKTRWKHSDRGNKCLIFSENEEITYERGTGVAPEYCGSPSCSGTWLVLT